MTRSTVATLCVMFGPAARRHCTYTSFLVTMARYALPARAGEEAERLLLAEP